MDPPVYFTDVPLGERANAVLTEGVQATPAARLNKRAVDPAAATASLLAALPATIQQLALTNLPSASAVIASEIGSPTLPAWFQSLPTEVRTYFLIGRSPAGPTDQPLGIGSPAGPTDQPLGIRIDDTPIFGGPITRSSMLTSMITSAMSSASSSARSASPTDAPSLEPDIADSKGLSTGAKAGIGVGIAILFILAVLLGFSLVVRCKKRRAADVPYADDKQKSQHEAVPITGTAPPLELKELPANEEIVYKSFPELDSNSTQRQPLTELGISTPRPAALQLSETPPQQVVSAFDPHGPLSSEAYSESRASTTGPLGESARQKFPLATNTVPNVPQVTSPESSTSIHKPSHITNMASDGAASAVLPASTGSSTIARTPSMSEKELALSSVGFGILSQHSVSPAGKLATLREEQARLAEKRKRLEALQAIETQEEDLQRKIQELEAASTSNV